VTINTHRCGNLKKTKTMMKRLRKPKDNFINHENFKINLQTGALLLTLTQSSICPEERRTSSMRRHVARVRDLGKI